MRRRTRASGGMGALGGVLAVLVSVPAEWYGAAPGDSYVFDPPTFSPLWVAQTVVPVATLLAVALILVGLVGLVRRDWPISGRLRRWSGVVAAGGLALFALGAFTFTLATRAASAGIGDLTSIGGVLFGLAGLGLGALLAAPALVALGVGYARTERPLVGYLLAGAPLIAAAVAAGGPDGVGSFPVVLPLGLAFVALGVELWEHPEPVPEAGTDDATEESGSDSGGDADSTADSGSDSTDDSDPSDGATEDR